MVVESHEFWCDGEGCTSQGAMLAPSWPYSTGEDVVCDAKIGAVGLAAFVEFVGPEEKAFDIDDWDETSEWLPGVDAEDALRDEKPV